MIIKEALGHATERMQATVRVLRDDLAAIRTGRASPALIEKLTIMYYNQPTPLNQLATISSPEPRLLAIRPFDVSLIKDVENAILRSDLGLTPANDGKVIRLAIPPLTEERRRELTRMVGGRVEESRVATRNVRRDILNDLRDFERDKLITEDELTQGQKELQNLTDKCVEEINQVGQRKQEEIMQV